MSVENKIRELMNRKLDENFPGMGKNKEDSAPSQGSSQHPEVQQMHKDGMSASKPTNAVNKLAAGAGAKESAPAKQGSSQDASIDLQTTQDNQGKAQAGKAKKQPEVKNTGAGSAPNFTQVADPRSVINQSSSKGNVHKEETEVEELETISEEEYNALSDEEKAGYELVENDSEEVEVITEEEFEALSDEEKEEWEEVELEVEEDDDEELEEGMVKTANKAAKRAFVQKLGNKVSSFSTPRAHVQAGRHELRKEELQQDVLNLFSSETELSEEFKSKAASLFEAVVTARVAHEVEQLQDVLAEEAANTIGELQEELINKVDSYLNYVAEQWLEQNQVAVVDGLRSEITEDFIAGLKVLFKEHYIEVPEEKYDVIGEMQAQIDALTEKLNETMEQAIAINSELAEAKRDAIFTKVTSDLAQTEVEKLRGLVEEIEFENEELFEQKMVVVKNNYFPKSTTSSPIVEETGASNEVETSPTVAKYAELLSRNTFGK